MYLLKLVMWLHKCVHFLLTCTCDFAKHDQCAMFCALFDVLNIKFSEKVVNDKWNLLNP